MTDLTSRQRQVAALVAEARTNKQIAAELQLSERRVRALIRSVAKALHADANRDDRVQVAKLWIEQDAA